MTRSLRPLTRMLTKRETSQVGAKKGADSGRGHRSGMRHMSRRRIALRVKGTFIAVKAPRVLGRALNGIRFRVPFHIH
jgi:hypothetical protein